jgi:VWFA-related protein
MNVRTHVFKILTLALIVGRPSVAVHAQLVAQPVDPGASEIAVAIVDKNNRLVSGLTKDDLLVRLDDVQQEVLLLKEVPLTPVSIIAVDNSGSMRQLLGPIVEAGKTIVREGKDNDLFALMRFVGRDNIAVSEKFTNDTNYLNRLLDNFFVQGGQTALIDAMYKAGEVLAAQKVVGNSRRTLIVISDGEDRNSEHNEEQLLELLTKNDIRVCFLGVLFNIPDGIGFDGKSSIKKSRDFVYRVSGATNGFAIIPRNREALADAAVQVSAGIHRQHVVVIRANLKTGGKGKIEIKLSTNSKYRDLQFFARPVLR